LPEHNKRGLTASLGKLHARIHLINQMTCTNPTPLPERVSPQDSAPAAMKPANIPTSAALAC